MLRRNSLLPITASASGLSRHLWIKRMGLLLLFCLFSLLYLRTFQSDPSDSPYHSPHPPISKWIAATKSGVGGSKSSSTTSKQFHSVLVPLLLATLSKPVLSYEEALKVNTGLCPTTSDSDGVDELNWSKLTSTELEKEREIVAQETLTTLGYSRMNVSELVGQTKKNRWGWSSSSKSHAKASKSTLGEREWDELFGTGRGIVMTAGNKDTIKRLITSLTILRHRHFCALSVEVFGFQEEFDAIGVNEREVLEALGNVTLRTIAETTKNQGRWKNYEIKGEAIARSSFSEVLYIDSDNIPTRDPTFLFDDRLYLENGVVLWPDFTKDLASTPIHRILNQPCDPKVWSIESGQVLVSKRARGGLNFAALVLAFQMQRRSDFWFGFSGGDKDTFRFAFNFLSLPYTPAPYWLSVAGSTMKNDEGRTFCGVAMIQYGLSTDEWEALDPVSDFVNPPYAPPLFIHASALKHSQSHKQRGNTFEMIKMSNSLIAQSAEVQDMKGGGYDHQGICADLWDSKGDAGDAVKGTTKSVGAYETGRVTVIDWNMAYGGMLEGFEDMYYDAGGLSGAW